MARHRRGTRPASACPKSPRGRRATALGAVLGLTVTSFAYLIFGGATPAGAATPGINSPFDCSGGTIYALEGSNNGATAPGSIVALDPASLGSAQVSSTHITDLPGETDPNALGMTPDGSEAIAVRRGPVGSKVPVYKYNTATATWTTDPNGTADGSSSNNFIAGAYDPANGIYYYADYDGDAKQATIFGYDVSHNTPVAGAVALADLPLNIAPDNGGINGDMTFDRDGNLYLIESEVTSVGIGIVRGPMPTTGHPIGSEPHLTQTTLSTFGKPESTLYKGVSFDNAGRLDVLFADDSTTYLEVLNPNNGAVTAGPTTLGLDENTRTGTDLASCALNPTLTAAANVTGRLNPSDQFALSVTGGNVSSNNTATTSGTATGVQSQKAGPVIAVTGTTYTVAQTAASGDLSDYNVSYSCIDSAASGRSVASGTGTSVTLNFPAAAAGSTGADVTCTFTDTPKPGVLDTVKTIYSINGNTSVDSTTPLAPGDVVVYHDTVTNTGVSTAATTLTDAVPANVTYTGTGEGWSCPTPSSPGTPCSQLVSVTAGNSVTEAYTVTLDQPLTATTIASQVTSDTGTCSSCRVENPTVSNLNVTNTIYSVNGDTSVDPTTPLKAGDVVVYHVNVFNTGGSDIAVTVNYPVPDNSTYTGAEGWYCPSGTDAGDHCEATGNIPAGVYTYVGYTVTLANPLPAGTQSITSHITTTAGTCSACTVVNPTVAVLDTTKSLTTVGGVAASAGTQINSGDQLTYSITTTNTGGSTGSTTVTETVPAHTTYTGTGEGWSCGGVTAGSTCTQDFTVGPTGSTTHTFTVTAGTLPAGTTTVANSVTTSNGTCSACSVSNATVGRLDTVKTIYSVNGNTAVNSNTPLKAGDVVVYDDTITNTGGSSVNTTLTDPVPANAVYTGSGEGWSCPNGSTSGTTCTRSKTIAANAGVVVQYTVTLTNPLTVGTTTISSHVTSTAGTCSSCTVNNPTVAVLSTVKTLSTVNGTAATSGTQLATADNAKYRIKVTNTGGTTGTTTLTETVPANTTYTGTGEGWTCGGVTAGSTCTQVVSAAAADSAQVTFTVTVGALPGGVGNIVNSVTTSAGSCSACAVSTATVARLDTVKTVSRVDGGNADATTPVGSGQQVTYTLTVTNSGGSAGSTVLTETVPDHTTYTGTGEGWTCAGGQTSGSQCTQTVTAPASGSTAVPFTVTVGALPNGTTSVDNTVVSSAGTCSACTITEPTVASLATTKTLTTVAGAPATSGSQVKPGDVLGYTITVTNNGGTAGSTTLAETVPAHTTYTGTGEGWSCTDPTGSCFQVVTAQPGSPNAVAFTVTVDPTLPAGATAVANTVSSTNGSCASCSVDTNTTARLDTVKTVTQVDGDPADASTPVKATDTVTYSITVSNTGGSAGTTTLTETVPDHTTYTGNAGEGWTCAGVTAGSHCTQDVTAAATGSTSVTFTVTVGTLPSGVHSVANSVTTSAGTCSSCSVSNQTVGALDTVKALTTIDGSPVAAGTPVADGNTLGYTITVTNTGGAAAMTTLTETVPDNTTYTGTGEGWSCAASTAGSTCTQDVTAPAAGSQMVTFTVKVGTLPAGAKHVDNTVSTSAGTCSSCTVAEPTVGDLHTVKTLVTVNGSPAGAGVAIGPGNVLGYRITVTNTGGASATTKLSETVPENTTYTGTAQGWDCDGTAALSTCVYDNATAPAAGSNSFDFTVTVAASLGSAATIQNTVVSSAGSCTACHVTNPTVADLDVAKTLSTVNGSAATPDTEVEAGDVLGYTITVTNSGGTDGATTLTETVPADTTYTGLNENWNCANDSAGSTCTQDVSAGAGSSAAVTFTVTVDPAAPVGSAPVHNTVSSSDGSCTACTVDTPWQAADVAVVKTVDRTRVHVGDTVRFTITVTNNGPDAATGVSVLDTPTGMTIKSALASVGTYDDTTGIWTVGALPKGLSATLTTTAQLTAHTARNVADAVNPSQVDPDPSNNTSTVTLHVPTAPVTPVTPATPGGSSSPRHPSTPADPVGPSDPPTGTHRQHSTTTESSTPLAGTGVPVWTLLRLVGLLLAVGIGLTVAARRRPESRRDS